MINEKVSVYGSTGFIGGRYIQLYKNCIPISRNTRQPQTNNILYFISTNNNYNIFSDEKLDIKVNLEILIETLKSCKEKYGNKFVFNFISSWFVYGKTPEFPAKETTHCNPKGFYSITKRTAEQLLISYCETHDINYRILRLCNVYGMKNQGFSKKRNALQYLIDEVANNRDVSLYDNGENIRDFMHVDDVCAAIDLVINKSKTNEVYNVGSGIPYKFRDLLQYVKEKTGSTSNFLNVEPPDFHKKVQVKNMYLNVDKIKELGFKQKIKIFEGIDIILKSRANNEK